MAVSKQGNGTKRSGKSLFSRRGTAGGFWASDDERRQWIADNAYYRSLLRDEPDPIQDWLDAELEADRMAKAAKKAAKVAAKQPHTSQ